MSEVKALTLAVVLLPFLANTLIPADDAGRTTNIYVVALTEAAKEMDRQWSQYSGSVATDGNRIPTDYRHLVVAKEDSVRSDYPSVSDQIRFEYLTNSEIHARRRKLRKDFTFLRVCPATVEGPRVKVVVAQDWVTIVKGKPGVAISDWAAVFFRINPDTGQFRIDEVKLGGI